MSTDHSPTIQQIEHYEQGLPPEPTEPLVSRRRLRLAVTLLSILVLVLAVVGLVRSDTFIGIAGSGTVTGTIVDQDGNPLTAEIIVVGTKIATLTDGDGHFALTRVPVGIQVVVVAYQAVGDEYPVTVRANSVTDLGQVQFVSVTLPDEETE